MTELLPKNPAFDEECTKLNELEYVRKDRDYYKRLAEFAIEALEPFVDAGEFAVKMMDDSKLTFMDARDYFMWQTSRKLNMQAFRDAAKALSAIKGSQS